MNTENLLKNKWTWIFGGIILLIFIISIVGGSKEKSIPETSQQQALQEQPVKTTPESKIKVQKELNNVGLENCLSEANIWFNQAKQTAKEVLEEEKKTYNPYQAFIDQHTSSLDEIIISLSKELEDYKAECYKKYPQR